MTPRTKSLIAFTAATALFAGTQTYAPAQQKSGGPTPAANKGGGGAPARNSPAPRNSGGSQSDSPKSSSSNSSSDSSNSSSSSAPSNNTAPQQNSTATNNQNPPRTHTPIREQQNNPRITPINPRRDANATPTPPRNTTPPGLGTNPPTNTPAPGGSVRDRRRLPPGTFVSPTPIDDKLAQQPVIVLPNTAATWPWWFNNYFPTYGTFSGGNGIDDYSGYDDRNASGGWYDDNYADRHPRNPAPAPATPNPAPTTVTPAAPNAAASLESDPAYQQAVADVARLQAAYDEASRKVIDQLKKDSPEYRQLLDERAQANQRVEQAQEAVPAARQPQPGPDPAKVAPAAQRKLDLNTKITQMEQEAIRKDPQASAARKALEDATAQLTALRRAAGATR